jgi:cysteine desulfurase
MSKLIYLDHAATTPVHPEVLQEILPYFSDQFANPSTLYSFGKQARAGVDAARGQVAALIGADPSEIYFTAGATESDNWAIIGSAQATITTSGDLTGTNGSFTLVDTTPAADPYMSFSR